MLVLILGIFLLTLIFAFNLKESKSDLRLPPAIQTFPIIASLRWFFSDSVASNFLDIEKHYCQPIVRTIIGTKQ
ncbi:unnamed protein product [Allacma fusca]|uniref:Uncharacterized protein n=1 Tax=Allacma fusca TaxID=39272 RepID=A0A8J2JHA5_9HEXA|nr:unnamed protein product [Allacma fusca]